MAAPTSRTSSREPIRLLVFSASLRKDSLNTRLALLGRLALERHGAIVDFAAVKEFDGPSDDQDLEARDGIPPGPRELNRGLDLVEAAKLDPCMNKAWVEFLGEPGDGTGRVDAA